MFVCKNCGAHYNSEFLQCPQCGSTKRVTESEDKNNNSVIGTIISAAIILALLGLIGYGIYFILNPVIPESAMSDYETTTTSTTTTAEGETTTTTKTTETTTRVTTTKLIGAEGTPIGNHTYTIPEGFIVIDIPQEYFTQLGVPENTQCISSSSTESYCLGIYDDANFSINASNKPSINEGLTALGYSELIKASFYGKTYYYFYQVVGDQIVGGVYKNRSSDCILSVFNIHASEVNEDSLARLISIINTVS